MSFKNVGSLDRTIRMMSGAIFLALVILGTIVELSSPIGIMAIIAGVVLLATGFLSFCPLYSVLGLRTRKNDSA